MGPTANYPFHCLLKVLVARSGICQLALTLFGPNSRRSESSPVRKKTLREQFLVVAGFKKEEVEEMSLDEMSDEELQNARP
jgi:hypothetical protein